MEYCVDKPKGGWYLKSVRAWYGKEKIFKFRVVGEYSFDYVKCTVNRRSVSGFATVMEVSHMTAKNAVQNIVALSVI